MGAGQGSGDVLEAPEVRIGQIFQEILEHSCPPPDSVVEAIRTSSCTAVKPFPRHAISYGDDIARRTIYYQCDHCSYRWEITLRDLISLRGLPLLEKLQETKYRKLFAKQLSYGIDPLR